MTKEETPAEESTATPAAIPAQRFQWIRGDKEGNLEQFHYDEDNFTYFVSGTRIASDLIQEYLIPINDDSQILQQPAGVGVTYAKALEGSAPGMVAQSVDFQDNPEGTDQIFDAEGQPQKSAKELRLDEEQKARLMKPSENRAPNPNSITAPPPPKKQASPVRQLIEKAAKDEVTVDIKLKIELPKEGVYNLVKESFEVDLNKEITELVLEKYGIKVIRELFEKELEKSIKNHYKQ